MKYRARARKAIASRGFATTISSMTLSASTARPRSGLVVAGAALHNRAVFGSRRRVAWRQLEVRREEPSRSIGPVAGFGDLGEFQESSGVPTDLPLAHKHNADRRHDDERQDAH